jgi:type I restriction-modification system DNA methylase subunit
MFNIDKNNKNEIFNYYDNILNKDKSTYKSTNDEPTPLGLINEMVQKIPEELWKRKNLKILDPCCGNGNFSIVFFYKLKEYYSTRYILEKILYFNDINLERINNVKNIFNNKKYKLNITTNDFLNTRDNIKYDLIMANPPYALIGINGIRASKNHNLIKDFISKSLLNLKLNSYILFLTPDNWMSLSNRNILINELTKLQIIYLNIHLAKKYFKKIGSSFTWFIIQNCKYYKDIEVSGIWKNKVYNDIVKSKERSYIPLFYNNIVNNILIKTIDNNSFEKFNIQTSSQLHHTTQKNLFSNTKDSIHKYKIIHTPSQIIYSSKPHKYQNQYKVFISTTSNYELIIDKCGMTQSIVFILCKSLEEAKRIKKILECPLYVFINNICRYGNFNNIRILQKFPIPKITNVNNTNIYNYFHIINKEIEYITKNI